MKRGQPQRLGEVLRGAVMRPAKVTRARLVHAREAWAQAVGKKVAAHTRVTSLAGGTLHVRVDSSALLAQIDGFLREDILARLHKIWPAGNVLDLRLRLEDEGR